jgi:hypothetical protein
MVHHTTLRRKPNKTNKTKKGGKKGKMFSKTKPYSKKAKSVRVRQRRRRTVARRKMRGGGVYNPDGDNTPEDIYEEYTRLDKEINDKITTCNNEKEQSMKDLSEEIRRQETAINDKFKTCNDDNDEKKQLRVDFYRNNKDVINEINYKKQSVVAELYKSKREEKERINQAKIEKEEKDVIEKIQDASTNLKKFYDAYAEEEKKKNGYMKEKPFFGKDKQLAYENNYQGKKEFNSAHDKFTNAIYFTNFRNVNDYMEVQQQDPKNKTSAKVVVYERGDRPGGGNAKNVASNRNISGGEYTKTVDSNIYATYTPLDPENTTMNYEKLLGRCKMFKYEPCNFTIDRNGVIKLK